MALQTDHSMHSYSSSGSSLLVSTSINNHSITIVSFSMIIECRFLGCILGTSEDNLSWLGKIVSLIGDVSGKPYGTAIDIRMIESNG